MDWSTLLIKNDFIKITLIFTHKYFLSATIKRNEFCILSLRPY